MSSCRATTSSPGHACRTPQTRPYPADTWLFCVFVCVNLSINDLNFFFDAGVAWDSFDQFASDGNGTSSFKAKPVMSAGASLRVNLFGALILEPYLAVPIQKETKAVFGLNIVPGW